MLDVRTDEDASQAVVGGDDAGGRAGAEHPVVPVGADVRPVPVQVVGRAAADLVDGRLDLSGDEGVGAVSADHEAGADARRPTSTVGADHTAGPPVRAAQELADGEPEVDGGAGGGRSVGEQRIEHGPAGGVQRVDAVLRTDVDDGRPAGEVERGAPHGRGAGGADPLQQSPAMELDDRAAHEGVGRQRVAALPGPVDDDDVETGPGQQHRRRRARGAGADDDDVGVVGVHHRPQSWGRPAGRSSARRPACTRVSSGSRGWNVAARTSR